MTDKDQGRYVHTHFSECGGVVWLSSSLSNCMHYLLKDVTTLEAKYLESRWRELFCFSTLSGFRLKLTYGENTVILADDFPS